MNLVQFLCRLLGGVVPVAGEEMGSIENEGNGWYAEKVTDRKVEEISNPFFKLLKVHGSAWYGRLLLAALFVPMTVWLKDLLTGRPAGDDDDGLFG